LGLAEFFWSASLEQAAHNMASASSGETKIRRREIMKSPQDDTDLLAN
jgi:hypothetical protein